MRRFGPVCFALLMMVALRGTVQAQAALEAGLGAGRAVTSTAPAQGLGKSIGGAFGSLDNVLKSGQTPAASAGTSQVLSPSRSAVKPPKKTTPTADVRIYEDPKQIQSGLAYDELVRRFGPAAMELSGAAGHKTLTYAGKDGMTQVELQDEKVILVETARPQQSAVVALK